MELLQEHQNNIFSYFRMKISKLNCTSTNASKNIQHSKAF